MALYLVFHQHSAKFPKHFPESRSTSWLTHFVGIPQRLSNVFKVDLEPFPLGLYYFEDLHHCARFDVDQCMDISVDIFVSFWTRMD